ncbi:MAG TPA: LysR family transcriptional regulator [Chloroflexota bacterium]
MERRQLRAFVEVATSGHFGRAAERLHVTQPALTQRIQALEAELGLQLLERNAREVRLTPAGAVLLPHAMRLVQVEDQGLRALKAYSSGMVGRLRLAYPSAGDVATAGVIIAEFRRRFPAVDVETISGSSGANLQLLQENAADAAVVLISSTRPEGIETRTLRREEIILALGSDHHLAKMERVPVTALRGVPFGMPPSAAKTDLISSVQRWVERHMGEDLNVVSEQALELTIEAVARSGSLAILVVRRLAPNPKAGIAYRPMSPAPIIELALAYRRGDPSPNLANLLQVVDELAFDDSDVPEDSELV